MPLIPNNPVWDFSTPESTAISLAALANRMTSNPRPSPNAPADVLNEVATSNAEQQGTVAGAGTVLPIVYGTRNVGAKICGVIIYQGNLILLAAWCLGEINGYTAVYCNDLPMPASVTVVNYNGTQTQTPDPTLVAAFASYGLSYGDALPGVAYSVLTFPPGSTTGFPRLTARLGGMKVRQLGEPQRNLLTYSNTFTNAAWSSTATVTANQTGPDSLTTTGTTLTDSSGAAGQATSQTITVTNDAGTYCASVYVKKTTGGTAPTFGIKVNLTGGTGVDLRARLNTDTGAFDVATGGNVAKANVSVVDCGAWWRFIGKVTNNTTGNTSLLLGLYPATNAYGTLTSDSAATTGAATVAWAMLARESSASAYQPIRTTYAADSTPTWSRTPALHMADFITSTEYGMGRKVDWNSVCSLELANSVLCGTEQKRYMDLALDTSQTGETWLTVLRDYAGCYCVPEGGQYRLIPDIPGLSIYSFGTGDILAGSLKMTKRGTSESPTCIEVTYTDSTVLPWRDKVATTYYPGVLAGTVPRRMSKISRPGTRRFSEANRYAVERLNEATLNDLSITFQCFDVGMRIQAGDIIDVTHPRGLTAKLFRVMNCAPVAPGRWSISATEYDAAKYSSEVATAPSAPDTVLPSPLSPPVPTGLTATPDIYQDATGLFGSRFAITWTSVATTYPFAKAYAVNVTQGGVIKETATVTGVTSYLTKALTEGLPYVVSVAVITTVDVVGTAASTTRVLDGKSAKPSDVPLLSGYEVGGWVHLQWTPATDLDLMAHEIRYSTTGGSWASATLLDRIAAPGVRYDTKVVPAGTWRFWIKGLDSVRSVAYPWGQESVNAAYCDITVTSDTSSFLAGEYTFASASLTNMTEYTDGGGHYWISNNGTTWATNFNGANLSTFTNPLWSYPGGFTSTFDTSHYDFGASITGAWVGVAPHTDVYGAAATAYLELSTVNSGYTGYSSLQQSATMRWAYVSITGTGTLRVDAWPTVRVTTVGRTEGGSIQTSSLGPATVTLTGKYAKAVSVNVTGSQASPTSGIQIVIDNVTVSTTGTNSFDVYAFQGGVKIQTTVYYNFAGV